ncbi:class I SAM-dependent methyltransferase [Saccharophagus degradans]|uniref:Secreted protein n=1 Tax=Saccharophagus degradans (strain 2-40 / ATCC 43961 / DSM 17024) TaxID=203122 RepID=Q21EW8_SACD2|nr:class I SAM-dependent methyltransferase [Saccharophagus degradans]ABD82761.1 conserved hypothetical protein [Saccharophagus degradans 2-40]
MKSAKALSEFIAHNSIKGFLAQDEAERLMDLAVQSAALGPVLEIGSYCGKSTIYLGEACKHSGNSLFAVDHHRGSEEHQLGEEYHDSELYDAQIKRMDSLPTFRRSVYLAGLESTVIPIVASSQQLTPLWAIPLGMVFVDGGHSEAAALFDCSEWAKHIVPGGILAVHDLFEHPEDGGQAPFNAFNAVLKTGQWELLPQVNSLGALRRK